MALKRMVLQIGMGTSIAAGTIPGRRCGRCATRCGTTRCRSPDALGLPVDSMQVEVRIGVPRPDLVDKAAVLAVLPHGTGTVEVVRRRARDRQRRRRRQRDRQRRRGGQARPAGGPLEMALKRVITEFGTGNDLHGGDYTKAAVRAVEDAIHHSSLEPHSQPRHRFADDAGRGRRSACSSRTGSTPAGQGGAAARRGHRAGGQRRPRRAGRHLQRRRVIASAAVTVRLDCRDAANQ